MGRNARRRRTLAEQARKPGHPGQPDPRGNRRQRRHPERVNAAADRVDLDALERRARSL